MTRYRKLPVEVEAWQIVEGDLRKIAPDWLRAAMDGGTVQVFGKMFGVEYVKIETREGTMRGNRGDWIVRGVEGELYPVKPDIFAKTYEPVG